VVEADWKATSVPAPIRHRKFTPHGFIIVLSWLDDEDRKSEWRAVVASVVRGAVLGYGSSATSRWGPNFRRNLWHRRESADYDVLQFAASGTGKVPSESISSPQFGLPLVS